MHYRAKRNFHYSVPQHKSAILKEKNAKNQSLFVFLKKNLKVLSHQSFEGTWRLRNEEKI